MKHRLAAVAVVVLSFVATAAVHAGNSTDPAPAAPDVQDFLRSLQSPTGTPAPTLNSCFGDCLQTYYWPCVAACNGDQDCLTNNCDQILDNCSCECNGGWCP